MDVPGAVLRVDAEPARLSEPGVGAISPVLGSRWQQADRNVSGPCIEPYGVGRRQAIHRALSHRAATAGLAAASPGAAPSLEKGASLGAQACRRSTSGLPYLGGHRP